MTEPCDCMSVISNGASARYFLTTYCIDEDFTGVRFKNDFFHKKSSKKTALWEQTCDIRFRKNKKEKRADYGGMD